MLPPDYRRWTDRSMSLRTTRSAKARRLAWQPMLRASASVYEGLGSANFDRKRALLELLVERVVVTDGNVEIRYVVPTGPDGEREPFWRLRSDYRNDNGPLQSADRTAAA